VCNFAKRQCSAKGNIFFVKIEDWCPTKKSRVLSLRFILRKTTIMFAQLKSFLMRGSVLDLAVGVIIGAAFGKIVSALVDQMLMPIIGALVGGVNFSTLSFKFIGVDVGYGAFIQAVIDFTLVGLALFVLLKATGQKPGPPALTPSEELLTEIRDLLQQQKQA
jgi:large conductance mechanosensitive channel